MVEFNPLWYDTFIQSTNEKGLIAHRIQQLIGDNHYSSVLEIGMGTDARFAKQLASLVNRYTIVERETSPVQLPANVNFLQEDWEDVSVHEKYDLVIASHITYYFSDKKAAIDKMFDTLTSNGKIVFVVNGKDPDYGPLKREFGRMIGVEHRFAYDELRAALQDCRIEESSVPSVVSASTYDDLYEALYMSFDHHPSEYLAHREDIINYFKDHFDKPQFTIQQKILIVSRG